MTSSVAPGARHSPARIRAATQTLQSCAGQRFAIKCMEMYNGLAMSSHFGRFFASSVGTKLLIGVTGFLLFAYLILHLVGNAIILFSQEAFNGYAHFLLSNPLVVPVEIGLLLIFLLHIYKTLRMWFDNRAARPVRYTKTAMAGHTSRKSVASTTMILSGLLIVIFVVIHVRQFKFGTHYLVEGSDAVRDLARTEIEVFQQPVWVAFYVICTLLVGLHLRHGIASAFQSLGLDHPTYTRQIVTWGIIVAVIIGGGLALIPIWVYLMH
jgi:succinate dehydrogenase / fumarate reductase, cytochrome b subunit